MSYIIDSKSCGWCRNVNCKLLTFICRNETFIEHSRLYCIKKQLIFTWFVPYLKCLHLRLDVYNQIRYVAVTERNQTYLDFLRHFTEEGTKLEHQQSLRYNILLTFVISCCHICWQMDGESNRGTADYLGGVRGWRFCCGCSLCLLSHGCFLLSPVFLPPFCFLLHVLTRQRLIPAYSLWQKLIPD